MHKRPFRIALGATLLLQALPGQVLADKVTDTPSIIQNAFGPNGSDLPNDGNQYCGPTTFTEQLFYFSSLGWTQLVGSATPATSLGLVELMGGLMNTSAGGGTTGAEFSDGVTTYFRAKGITAADFSISMTNAPTLNDLTSVNVPDTTAVALALHFYSSNGTSEGGHFVALAATTPAANPPNPDQAGTMTILNPHAPQPVGNGLENPQVISLLNFTTPHLGDIPAGSYLQIDPAQVGTYRSGQTALVLEAYGISLPGLPSAPLADWEIAGMQTLNTGTQTLDIITTVSGTGGLTLTSPGALLLSNSSNNAYSYSGGTTVEAGQVISQSNSGTPFGTGNLTLSGGGALVVQPFGNALTVALVGATQAGAVLSVDGGSIVLDRGANTSLTFTVGSETTGATPNLQMAPGAYLIIAATDVIENLGVTETLQIAGTGANLPPLENGIVQASIVGTSMNSAVQAGDFLTYENGFKKASYTLSSVTPIAGTTATTIYEVDDNQSVTGTSEVHVVKVDSGNAISSGGSGSKLVVAGGGIILNGGNVSVETLELGGPLGSIFTGTNGGEISSNISGSKGLTVFGPGALVLSGNSTYTGTTRVAGDLVVNGSVGSGSFLLEKSAQLSGIGTIQGDGVLYGTVSPGDGTVGILSFGGTLDFEIGSTYAWELNAATDGTDGAGSDWDLLSVMGDLSFEGNSRATSLLTLSFGPGVGGPDSGLSFWNEDHSWLIAQSQNGSILGQQNLLPFAPDYNKGSFSISSSTDGSQLFLKYHAVPEPGTAGLAILGGSLLLLIRRTTRQPRSRIPA